MHAVTSLSMVSLQHFGFLSMDWTKRNQVEEYTQNDSSITFEPKQPPHIIFILTDDQGFNDIGYHNPAIRTPTLDKLAAEGVKLENYYVQPICTPSRSQLITGRPSAFHHPASPAQLPPPRHDHAPTATAGSGVRYSHVWTTTGMAPVTDRGGKYSTHLYTQRVRKILSTHDPSHQPLFMFLSLQAVHTPLQSPKAYIYPYRGMGNVARRKYAAMVSIVDEAVRNVTYALRKYGYYRNSVLIFSTDNGAQPFTGGSNWPLRGRKGTYWEGGVRGVGFVHSPLLRNRRRVSKALMHITDWYPTLVGLAGGNVSLTEGLDGYDVWPTISEGKESPRLKILHNIDPLHRRSGLPQSGSGQEGQHVWDTTVQAAIRVGDWKLLTGDPGHGDWVPPQVLANFPGSWWTLERNTGGTGKSVWLFNVTGDPYERSDLALQRPDVVKQLLTRLAYYNRTVVPVRFPADNPRANPDRNGGAWVPWVGGDEDEQKWNGIYKKGRDKKKKKCKLRSFFKKLNTRIMSNRI
ncbi:unnamed protein product [Coregonus sp. 'balchen']|nr:unnamed protein product [Coregonus sp. 'balchen']